MDFIWKYRCALWNRSNKLRAKADKLWIRSLDDFTVKNNKLRSESQKLWAESDKLWAEADILWADAVLEVYGNIRMEWKNLSKEKQSYECHLETGEVFKP